jgi:adenylate kinase
MSVIFLAGVHGVGKGFLGAPVANALGISHFTASQLIREEKGQATWGKDKKTFDLDDNQRNNEIHNNIDQLLYNKLDK